MENVTNPTPHSSRQPSAAGQSESRTPPFPVEDRNMRRHLWLLILVIAVIAVLPAFAGGDHGKCKYSTQDCLSTWPTR